MIPVDLPHNSDIDFKRFRFVGEQAEALGLRLDAARQSLKRTKKGTWARTHWQGVVDQLVLQWRNLPVLHDSDASMLDVPKWTIDYHFYERDDGIGHGFSEKLMDRFHEQANLDASWERARQLRYEKAVAGIII